MRCRDADTGVVVREQQLQDGRSIGVVRFFKRGVVEREQTVNERGNADGPSREWNVDEAGRRVLVRDETSRDGRTVGIARAWYPTGQRRRLGFHDDDGREQASVEFTEDGKLASLRCAGRPVFAADYDDRAACGFAGGPSTVTLFGGKGQATMRVVFDHGQRVRTETLWENGAVRELRETTADGGIERSFAADGTKRREVRRAGVASRSVVVLDQEFHESGKLVHERRWMPVDRGAEPTAETWWYLNGQTREAVRFEVVGDRRVRRDTTYHDNGRLASEGAWAAADARGDRGERPFGIHKSFDEEGRPRGESVYDERGRLTRERAFDERGAVVRDDEVFEDGSRKSVGR